MFTASGLLLALSEYLDVLASGEDTAFRTPLIEELTGAYSTALLFPVLLYVFRRWPHSRRALARRVSLYLGVLALFSVAKTLLMVWSRALLFPAAGLGSYGVGRMAYRFPMEMAKDVVFFWLFAALVYFWGVRSEARARELHTSRLEARLAEARLHALQLQIQPHFMFNALNTISSMMYDDPRGADALVGRLGELLRAAMREGGPQEVVLAEEIDFLEGYLEIMRARFGERLRVEMEIDSTTRDALVPHLILQPLVENSIRYAVEASDAPVRVEVRAARRGASVLLAVRDTGPGAPGDPSLLIGAGIGLSNVADRLEHLFGSEHRFRLANAAGGGLLAEIEIPFRRVTDARRTAGGPA